MCLYPAFFSPEISEIDIIKVYADSVADLPGLKVGDKVIELDSCPIPGCPAKVAKTRWQRKANKYQLKINLLKV
jgi:C-terminal processing protease CtpA/Prc